MVMAQSLFMRLKESDSECQIDVLAPAWTFPLLDRMPEVSKGISMPLLHGQFELFKRIQLGKKLRADKYDQAIILPNSWKSALIPFFANIPLRTGYVGEGRWGLVNNVRLLDKKNLTMTVQRFVALGSEENAELVPEYLTPKLNIDQQSQQRVTEKFLYKQTDKIIALCAGAEYGSAKRWPAKHYAELAINKLDQGWSVLLFGSEKDKEVTQQINALAGNACQDLSGKTSLAEAVDLMSLAQVVITNDSGLMHVAAALNKKVIAIYGSSDPDFTPPLSMRATIINLNLDCSPCFERDCPLGHMQCLTDILPSQVLAEIDR